MHFDTPISRSDYHYDQLSQIDRKDLSPIRGDTLRIDGNVVEIIRMEDIFISEYNSISGRRAIFEDDGKSGWLYLTNQNDQSIAGDCWIYNRIPPIPIDAVACYQDNPPPPVSIEYATTEAIIDIVEKCHLHFLWSNDGESVALLLGQSAYGFISMHEHRGYSKKLIKDGPWGFVFDEVKYIEIFYSSSNY